MRVLAMALAPAAADPVGDALLDLGTRLDPRWFWLALLIPAALVLLWFGHRQLRDLRSSAFLEPKGRPALDDDDAVPATWRRTLARLERHPPTPIAEAEPGPVRIRGRIVRASETFGPAGDRACLYRNRAGAPPRAAVAADAMVVADATGKCGVEGLARARVRAPTEPVRRGHGSIALYVGDEVEVFGTFDEDRIEAEGAPEQTVYGSIGSRGPIEIRVVERPHAPHHASPASTDDPDPEPAP